MSKNCNNCAWFCHADGRCYGLATQPYGAPFTVGIEIKREGCDMWTFDGLEDWEREQTDTLVTMEMAK